MERRIILNEDFVLFYRLQNPKVRQKIKFVFSLIQSEPRVPTKFFKYLINSEGIYEIRIITHLKSIRILCFLEKDNSVVITNYFMKKTQKTPQKEIRTAEKLKREYLNDNYGGIGR
jgi:phage-related protein